ncbi:Aste57867_2045 [Aphanomyces stellatus]|uniref:Elongation factor Tu, chloroplastic n=1 Tax=Aphanomyces stellatus TaxID=120398 RepID=A0A485KAA0_9STRA|nr:hypothetical protein As57867_002041 [Aphanomyces stellatus]VFT79249.1 Aste57867_2045 [Aphanomyces stellatus]
MPFSSSPPMWTDSGKTSLVRSLSTHLSTAALDKNPQSKARGITLDLGFSSFTLPFADDDTNVAQITLVDCPGHASLIKTVIGGAHIIDMALLVIDAVKGIQMQTIESTVLAEIATPHVLVVLNKIDLYPEATREHDILRMSRTIRQFLQSSPELRDAPIVPVASGDADGTRAPLEMPALLAAMREHLHVPRRSAEGPLCYAIDHCFPLRGKGTVLTGTVLSGRVRVNDSIALPMVGAEKKVKSLQMFHSNVDQAIQGDRVGIRLHGLDASTLERGLAITPQSLGFTSNLVLRVHQIRFFSLACASGAKVHVTVGHATVLAKTTFFTGDRATDLFDATREYMYVPSLPPLQEKQVDDVWCLLQLEREILCPPSSQIVCSRLDTDVNKQLCRIAFYGPLAATIEHVATGVRIGKVKERRGVVDKTLDDGDVVVVRDLFRKETNLDIFRGLRVQNGRTLAVGTLDAAFGKTGKCRALFDVAGAMPGDAIVLRFTKMLFQEKTLAHRLRQTKTLYEAVDTPVDNADDCERRQAPSSDAVLLPIIAVDVEKKCRVGLVERLKGETAPNGSNPMVIATGLFATADEATAFVGAEVVTDANEHGHVEALFGKAGKVRVVFELGTMARVGDQLKLFEK